MNIIANKATDSLTALVKDHAWHRRRVAVLEATLASLVESEEHPTVTQRRVGALQVEVSREIGRD